MSGSRKVRMFVLIYRRVFPKLFLINGLIYYLDTLFSISARAWHALGNEFLKSRIGSCGADVYLHGRQTYIAKKNLHFGSNVHINDNAFIRGDGGVIIEDNVHISRNLTIYSANHNFEGLRLPYDETHLLKNVVIERNVWIGMNVSITPGVRIGEGAILGMGAVVTNDVPPRAIVGGNPAKVIRYRDEDHYHRLESAKLYGGVSGSPYE